jgi:hypothetical protein
LASGSATPRGDFTCLRASRTCCCVTLKLHLPLRARGIIARTHVGRT